MRRYTLKNGYKDKTSKTHGYKVEVSNATRNRFRDLLQRFRESGRSVSTGYILSEIARGLKSGEDLTEESIVKYLQEHEETEYQKADKEARKKRK